MSEEPEPEPSGDVNVQEGPSEAVEVVDLGAGLDVQDLPPGVTAFRVFHWLGNLVLLSILIYFVLSHDPDRFGDAGKQFGSVVVSPLLTMLAGATGYYFANRGGNNSSA